MPNTSSCLPHEQGSPPQTPGPLIGRARHPCSAKLPPGPPLRCCGPNYPGGQDGRRWGSNCKSSLSRIRAGRTVYWSSVSTSVGLAPSALDIQALGTIIPEKPGRSRACCASQAQQHSHNSNQTINARAHDARRACSTLQRPRGLRAGICGHRSIKKPSHAARSDRHRPTVSMPPICTAAAKRPAASC